MTTLKSYLNLEPDITASLLVSIQKRVRATRGTRGVYYGYRFLSFVLLFLCTWIKFEH